MQNLFYLNVHRRVNCKSFESFRIIPLLANGSVIFSELCNESEIEEYKNYIIGAKEHNNTYQGTIDDFKKQIKSLQEKLDVTTKEKYEAEKNYQILEFKYNEISNKLKKGTI